MEYVKVLRSLKNKQILYQMRFNDVIRIQVELAFKNILNVLLLKS